MEIQAIKRSSRPAELLRQGVTRLIELVATREFEQALFEASRAATRCSHLTAFVSSPSSLPRAVVAANAGPLPLARMLAERYVRQYWDLDPANSYAVASGVPEEGAALRIHSCDIASAQYRSDCYTGVELDDRFSLIQPVCGKLYRLNFYFPTCVGAFTDDVMRDIMESSDLLMALLARHERASIMHCAPPPDYFAEQLRFLHPSMPAREIEVCSGIARGLTSEGIAIECGVSMNTVLTYRKRAYTRLGISSQNELLRHLLTGSIH